MTEAYQRYADRGRWAREAPAWLARAAERWGLRLHGRLAGGYASEVHACTDERGRELVLKLGLPALAPAIEAAALRWWDGRGAVRLYDFDAELGALLLERIVPGRALPPGDEAGALAAAASVLRALRGVEPPPAGEFPTAAEAFESYLERCRAEAEPGTAGLPLLDESREAARVLEATATRRVLLHGDFLDKNILLGEHGYVAIDPIPRLGDPCSDVGFFAAGRQPASGIVGRATALAAALDLDPARAARWAAVWAVGEACETWRADSEQLQAWARGPEIRRLLEA